MVEVGLDQASHYKHSPLQASEAGSIALFGVIPVCQPTEREEAVESSPAVPISNISKVSTRVFARVDAETRQGK